ncbi:MAG: EamA family transporter [Candidatus Poribacteria bacterium]|nr:EamA family transporter [Candidatus Poribacteria bacterium]
MTPVFISLILLSAFLHALWNYYGKSSHSPQLFFFWIGLFTTGVAVVAFAIQLPTVPPSVWIYIIASGAVHFFYWCALSQAYTLGEISYVYPIARSAPGFIPVFAFLFLGERMPVQGLIGIFCVVFSIYLLQQRGGGQTFKELIRYMRQPDSVWAFATLGTVILYSLIDKAGMAEFHAHSTQPPVWRAMTYYLTEGVIALTFYGLYIVLRFPRQEITKIGRREWKAIIATGALAMISYTLILYVYMTQKVSYVVALRQCSVIFAVLIGTYVLKESQAKLRFAASAVMVIGMLLISTA